MYEYYDAYKAATGDADTQARWAHQLTWEVARHAVGEELVVYPLMEKHLGARGLELANQDRAEHQVCRRIFVSDPDSRVAHHPCALTQTVKELLYNLSNSTPGTAQYDEILQKVMAHLRPHNESEENEDLPMLESKLGEEYSASAAQSFKRTKKFVPTRCVLLLFFSDACLSMTARTGRIPRPPTVLLSRHSLGSSLRPLTNYATRSIHSRRKR